MQKKKLKFDDTSLSQEKNGSLKNEDLKIITQCLKDNKYEHIPHEELCAKLLSYRMKQFCIVCNTTYAPFASKNLGESLNFNHN